MNDKLRTDATDLLFDAILQLKTKEECYNFLLFLAYGLCVNYPETLYLWGVPFWRELSHNRHFHKKESG